MLIQIKNAQGARHERVSVPFSKMKLAIARILSEAGFIDNVKSKKKKVGKSEFSFIEADLKYEDGEGVIKGIKLISKPSRRLYIKGDKIKSVRSNFGISIISTPKGVLSGDQAKKLNLGGEIICEVW